MKTIKIINLFNKLANGEEVPEKIKWKGQIYEYSDNDKFYYQKGYSMYRDFYANGNCLNEEVEIIEDKIKRIEERESGWWANSADGNVSTLKQAVNELIDAVNEMRKEK